MTTTATSQTITDGDPLKQGGKTYRLWKLNVSANWFQFMFCQRRLSVCSKRRALLQFISPSLRA
jgi:hypothetical protein